MEFICKSEGCKLDGDRPYEVHIPMEVYERHNMATLFCPRCGSELEKRGASPPEDRA